MIYFVVLHSPAELSIPSFSQPSAASQRTIIRFCKRRVEMNRNTNYTLSWKPLLGTRIYDNASRKRVDVKRRYCLLCFLIGCLGWIPSILFEDVWKIGSRPLRLLASVACYLLVSYAVTFAFHLFLRRMNQKGKLSKYLETQDN